MIDLFLIKSRVPMGLFQWIFVAFACMTRKRPEREEWAFLRLQSVTVVCNSCCIRGKPHWWCARLQGSVC